MLAPGEKRLEVDHSSGAATRLWCIKLTTCPLSLTKPMSPPPFSPNLASPKQCSVLQLHTLHFHLQIFAFQKPFFVVKMSITLKFRIVHTLMRKTTQNPAVIQNQQDHTYCRLKNVIQLHFNATKITHFVSDLRNIIEIHFNATSFSSHL